MKLSKKFIEDLHKIGEDAFIEKNQWIWKLVPDIIIDNLQKRGISQGDLEGIVCLSVEEAKEIAEKLKDLSEGFFLQTGNIDSRAIEWEICLIEKIEQAEGK